MTFRLSLLSSLLPLSLLLTACGDSGSGLDGDKRVSALTASEVVTLCEFYVDELDAPRTISCGSRTRSFLSQTECQTRVNRFRSSCSVTVAQYEDCIEAYAEDECGRPEVCAKISDCD